MAGSAAENILGAGAFVTKASYQLEWTLVLAMALNALCFRMEMDVTKVNGWGVLPRTMQGTGWCVGDPWVPPSTTSWRPPPPRQPP